jgi:CRP/FNR family transcriptional regulator, cyclic AMP receptor protein
VTNGPPLKELFHLFLTGWRATNEKKKREPEMAANIALQTEIKNIPWFSELTSFQVERLIAISTVRVFTPGEEIFREGDRADCVYIILSGEILLENYIPSLGKVGTVKAEALDVIGWSSLTPVVRQRTATARVCRSVRVLAIEGEALTRLCEEDHDLGFLVMRRIANIVASQFLTTRLHLYDLIRNTSHSLSQSNLF